MNNIVIKGAKDILEITIPEDLDFTELLKELEGKITNSPLFFKGAVVAFIWNGRKITSGERKAVTSLLTNHNIAWNKEKDQMEKPKKSQKVDPILSALAIKECLFVSKNVRAGTRIESDGHIIIFGNVHAGSEIIAAGNVFVWGVLRGIVHAGYKGAKDASIAALLLNPTQLRIAETVAINPQHTTRETQELCPEHATIEGEDITVKPWSQKKEN